jgi:hypothetical protein
LSNLGCNLSPGPYGVCAIDHTGTPWGFWKDGVPQLASALASACHVPCSADNVATLSGLRSRVKRTALVLVQLQEFAGRWPKSQLDLVNECERR